MADEDLKQTSPIHVESGILPAPDDPSVSSGPPSDPVPPASLVPDRRTFLVWATGASLGATGFFLLATGVQALMPPGRSPDGMTEVGDVVVALVSDLKIGEPMLTEYGDDRVYVFRTSRTRVLVFDAACPHARCTLQFNASTRQFDCPCHGSSFTAEGTHLSGPAPRGMIPARFTVEGDRVIVSGFQS